MAHTLGVVTAVVVETYGSLEKTVMLSWSRDSLLKDNLNIANTISLKSAHILPLFTLIKSF